MISAVEIKNLRGIQHGKLEGLTPLTVLVGPNASGKSTILDALLKLQERIDIEPSPRRGVERRHEITDKMTDRN